MSKLENWLKGLIAAAISGAGTGMTALVIGIGVKKALVLIAVNALMGAGLYLKQSPLPNGQSQAK